MAKLKIDQLLVWTVADETVRLMNMPQFKVNIRRQRICEDEIMIEANTADEATARGREIGETLDWNDDNEWEDIEVIDVEYR